MKTIFQLILLLSLAAPAAAQFSPGLSGLVGLAAADKLPATPSALPARAGLGALNRQQVYAMTYEALSARLKEEVFDSGCYQDLINKKDPNGLNAMEQCSVILYTQSWFATVNPALWQGLPLDGQGWAYVRVLDTALSKIRPEAARTVYRGTGRQLAFQAGGPAVQLKAYTSTSASLEVAEWFLGAQEARIMVIRTSSARNISPYTQTGQEEERLLPRNIWVKPDRSEKKKVRVFNESTGREELREVEFVYLSEVPAP